MILTQKIPVTVELNDKDNNNADTGIALGTFLYIFPGGASQLQVQAVQVQFMVRFAAGVYAFTALQKL
jgi:hypothetical protein